MAKKKKSGGPSKSQAVRDYLKSKPKAGPTEVAAELKKKGIVVALSQVSNVKAALEGRKPGKKRRKVKRRKASVGRPAGTVSDKVSMGALIEAKAFAAKAGGIDKAIQVLKTLQKLS